MISVKIVSYASMSHEVIDDVLIVKVGTNTLTTEGDAGTKVLDTGVFDEVGEQIQHLREEGENVILVTSAAITAGMIESETKVRPDEREDMAELQRLATLGWLPLLNQWQKSLSGNIIAPLQLTRQELSTKTPERDEALRTISRNLDKGDIPVINENDAISHEEITFGDNDILAAILAAKISRSAFFGSRVNLVYLTDRNGFYTDPNDADTLVRMIKDITLYDHLAGDPTQPGSKGGMRSKFEAAKIVGGYGIEMWVANGRTENAIHRAMEGEIGTYFEPWAAD